MDKIPQKDTTKDMKNLKFKRDGFTMLEFVFVIIVLGILGSIGMSRYEDNTTREASDSILSDIRYTQHLALLDDKFNPNISNWQRAYWRIGFMFCSGSTNYFEYIGSDMNYGGGSNINDNEAAIDPLTGKLLNWNTSKTCKDGKGNSNTSNRIFLTHKYGITNIQWLGSCSNAQYIGFDHFGRPHQGFQNINIPSSESYLKSVCTIRFTLDNGDNFRINIEPETGYASIALEPNS